jgi:hypothetical protein
MGTVRAWRTIFAVGIATLWVAAGVHCRLEILPGFEFLACCEQPKAEKSPAQHEKDCRGDACAAIEQGLYKSAPSQQAPIKPLLASVAWLVPLPDAGRLSAPDFPNQFACAPPELPRLWRFSQRAALPPRAPSFVS